MKYLQWLKDMPKNLPVGKLKLTKRKLSLAIYLLLAGVLLWGGHAALHYFGTF